MSERKATRRARKPAANNPFVSPGASDTVNYVAKGREGGAVMSETPQLADLQGQLWCAKSKLAGARALVEAHEGYAGDHELQDIWNLLSEALDTVFDVAERLGEKRAKTD
ncbi:MAG: hypothetical protein IRZ28_21710 [Steroidobacteraceae bacterium]|nr:hypothetical protein [Steroidobacteraceae bacterium]